MTQQDLKRVQQIDQELLCMVDSICKKHNIEYYLFFGSLIGAVRHKGHIPWDDDVDIAMTRDNYVRFYELAQKELDSEKYHLKVMGSGSLDYISEIKIGRRGTTFCLPGSERFDIMNEVQLDIFVIEDWKECSPSLMKLKWRLWKLLSLVKLNKSEKANLCFCIDQSNKRFKLLYKSIIWLTHLFPLVFTEKQIERFGRWLLIDDRGDTDYYVMPTILEPNPVFPKTWFIDALNAEYDNMFFPIPSGYHEILTQCYGDYMKLPPKEKQLRSNFDIWLFNEDKTV